MNVFKLLTLFPHFHCIYILFDFALIFIRLLLFDDEFQLSVHDFDSFLISVGFSIVFNGFLLIFNSFSKIVLMDYH